MTEIEGRVKVSVVIPVFNEGTTIRTLLQRVQEIDVEKEIIIVDDGSNDDTPEFLISCRFGGVWGKERRAPARLSVTDGVHPGAPRIPLFDKEG